jgi:hypothetical protein
MDTAIDTLKIYDRLKAANLNENAAKELAEVFREVSFESQKGLATKEDITRLEQTTKSDLLQLKTEIGGELKLIKWMLGILIAGVLSLVLKAFFAV